MKNDFMQALICMILGVTTGMFLSVEGQKVLNKYIIRTCPKQVNHQLMVVSGLIGDAFYCVDKRYL